MRTFSKKKLVVTAAVAAVLVGTGTAAFAYWTSQGEGKGSATTAAEATTLVVKQTTSPEGMYPGDSAQDLVIKVTNPGPNKVQVDTVTVVPTVKMADGVEGTCDASDYQVNGEQLVDRGPPSPSTGRPSSSTPRPTRTRRTPCSSSTRPARPSARTPTRTAARARRCSSPTPRADLAPLTATRRTAGRPQGTTDERTRHDPGTRCPGTARRAPRGRPGRPASRHRGRGRPPGQGRHRHRELEGLLPLRHG